MTRPPNFNETDHLRDAIYRVYRRRVSEWFQDIDFDNLDFSISRHNLAVACRPNPEDTLLEAVARMMLFESAREQFAERLVGGSDGAGTTTYRTDVRRRTRPKIKLYFLEDANDVEPGYAPVDGQITFRLMNHTPDTINPTIARTYAQRIKSNFQSGGGFVWKKGRNMYSYSDWDKGYQMQLLCRTEAEARRIVDAVLDVQTDTPEWSYFNEKVNAEPASAFPTIPDVDRAYGEQRRQPRRRPVADVRFQYASLEVLGVANPIVLVDRTGVLPTALIS